MIYYVLLEDSYLTVTNEFNELEPYNRHFQAGEEFVLSSRPKGCDVVVLRNGKFTVCVDRELLAERFEEIWTGTKIFVRGKGSGNEPKDA